MAQELAADAGAAVQHGRWSGQGLRASEACRWPTSCELLLVGGGGADREVGPIHRVAKLFAGVVLRVHSRAVAGQGIIRVLQ